MKTVMIVKRVVTIYVKGSDNFEDKFVQVEYKVAY